MPFHLKARVAAGRGARPVLQLLVAEILALETWRERRRRDGGVQDGVVPETAAVGAQFRIPQPFVDALIHRGLIGTEASGIVGLAEGIGQQGQVMGIHGPHGAEIDGVAIHGLANHMRGLKVQIVIPAGFPLGFLESAGRAAPFQEAVLFGIAMFRPPVVPDDEPGIDFFKEVQVVEIALVHFPDAQRAHGRLGTIDADAAAAMIPVTIVRHRAFGRLTGKDGADRVAGNHRIVDRRQIGIEKAVPAEIRRRIGGLEPAPAHRMRQPAVVVGVDPGVVEIV